MGTSIILKEWIGFKRVRSEVGVQWHGNCHRCGRTSILYPVGDRLFCAGCEHAEMQRRAVQQVVTNINNFHRPVILHPEEPVIECHVMNASYRTSGKIVVPRVQFAPKKSPRHLVLAACAGGVGLSLFLMHRTWVGLCVGLAAAVLFMGVMLFRRHTNQS